MARQQSKLNYSCITENEIERHSKRFKKALLGLILVLDHLENPYEFLEQLINYGINSIVIMVERIDPEKGLPIQHLTGWSEKSLSFLAMKLGLSVSFPDLGTDLYLCAFMKHDSVS